MIADLVFGCDRIDPAVMDSSTGVFMSTTEVICSIDRTPLAPREKTPHIYMFIAVIVC